MVIASFIVPRKESVGKGKNPLDRDYFLWYNVYKNCVKELIPMKCPFCGYQESKVVDSRHSDDNLSIRRRRECLQCAKRFTTYEIIESLPIVIVKRDKSREVFDRQKLFNGMLRACQKRPVPMQVLERAVDEIETQIQNSLEREVSTTRIGEYVMEQLMHIDDVAYIRFASVYRQFKDIQSFHEAIRKLMDEEGTE